MLTPRQEEVYRTFVDLNYDYMETGRKLKIGYKAVMTTLFACHVKDGLPLTKQSDSRVTAYMVDKNGERAIEWHRPIQEQETEERILKLLEARTPVCKTIPKSKGKYDPNIMVEWKLMDHHLGLHAWRKETGEDYDIKIAKKIMISAAKKIYGDCGKVHTTAIILGGDNMHADNRSEETERGHNKLDVDSRYDKSIDGIIEATTTSIDIAAQQSKNVIIEVLSGNHDFHSAKWLSYLLRSHYRTSKQITVDCSPMLHRFLQWGVSAMMYTHGHKGTDQRLANFFLNYIIENNLKGIKYKLIRKGHLHKSGSIYPAGLTEINGVKIEIFPTLAAADSYAAENAFESTRATVVTKFHKKYGELGSRPYKIAELMD